MIPQGVQVFVALDPIDMRLFFDRLSGLGKDQVGYDAGCGALFLFFGRRRDALKILLIEACTEVPGGQGAIRVHA